MKGLVPFDCAGQQEKSEVGGKDASAEANQKVDSEREEVYRTNAQ